MTQALDLGYFGGKDAIRIPKEIEIVVRGAEDDLYSMIHCAGSEIDVHFNPPRQTVTIFQTTRSPNDHYISHTVVARFTRRNSRFINLELLPDGSVLVNFEVLPFLHMQNETILNVEHIYHGFEANLLKNPLDEELVMCDWPYKHLQMILPAVKFFPKDTEAIALLTFGCITLDEYYGMLPHFERPIPPRRPRFYFDDDRRAAQFAALRKAALKSRNAPGGTGWTLSMAEGFLGTRMKEEKKRRK
ncbi:hypothetical protein AOR_1_458094 [Paecilomyces variotii No. 5]|uniref:Uncharacterized protein n=1 Tax=Byssochlamys spectabilis (strain No. 5 / NBRC 109023) TaxID=1356009 RepID=V5FXN7_BYSSN|nr:hypothetical protein AOR_1_458094 [Paecilomyces variotii No. 5]